jgi:hypothetical protein
MMIFRVEVEDKLWENRNSEFELLDDRDRFEDNQEVNFLHHGETDHEVVLPVKKVMDTDMECPVCNPEFTHEEGKKAIKEYFMRQFELTEGEILEEEVESDNHKFDFLVFSKLVVHYFDPSYFINGQYTSQMEKLLVEFADSDDFDLLPMTKEDLQSIMNGEEIQIAYVGDED